MDNTLTGIALILTFSPELIMDNSLLGLAAVITFVLGLVIGQMGLYDFIADKISNAKDRYSKAIAEFDQNKIQAILCFLNLRLCYRIKYVDENDVYVRVSGALNGFFLKARHEKLFINPRNIDNVKCVDSQTTNGHSFQTY